MTILQSSPPTPIALSPGITVYGNAIDIKGLSDTRVALVECIDQVTGDRAYLDLFTNERSAFIYRWVRDRIDADRWKIRSVKLCSDVPF
jgi:hypothetical protein